MTWLGIVVSTDRRRQRVDRFFHWPMIVLALAIIPLLVIEMLHPPEGWLSLALKIGFAIIWTAFVVEFVVKITIAESRLEYVQRNWLDLIIILVPVLRPLRVGASVTRTTRVFKLRGVGMKFLRYIGTIVIGMEATERFLQRIGVKSDGRKRPELMTRHQLIREVKEGRRRLDAWEAWHEAHEEHVREHEGACYVAATPKAEEEPEATPRAEPGTTSS